MEPSSSSPVEPEQTGEEEVSVDEATTSVGIEEAVVVLTMTTESEDDEATEREDVIEMADYGTVEDALEFHNPEMTEYAEPSGYSEANENPETPEGQPDATPSSESQEEVKSTR